MSFVYCYNIEEKKLYYLKLLPSMKMALEYEKYIKNLMKFIGEDYNLFIFSGNLIENIFNIHYPAPDGKLFTISFKVAYDVNSKFYKYKFISDISNSNHDISTNWNKLINIALDDHFNINMFSPIPETFLLSYHNYHDNIENNYFEYK